VHVRLWLFAQVSISPSSEGVPGGVALQRLLNITAWGGLLLCAIATVVGAAMLGIGHVSNNPVTGSMGRKVMGGGLAGASLIGVAGALVNWASRLGA
jgi:hypothetical protein